MTLSFERAPLRPAKVAMRVRVGLMHQQSIKTASRLSNRYIAATQLVEIQIQRLSCPTQVKSSHQTTQTLLKLNKWTESTLNKRPLPTSLNKSTSTGKCNNFQESDSHSINSNDYPKSNPKTPWNQRSINSKDKCMTGLWLVHLAGLSLSWSKESSFKIIRCNNLAKIVHLLKWSILKSKNCHSSQLTSKGTMGKTNKFAKIVPILKTLKMIQNRQMTTRMQSMRISKTWKFKQSTVVNNYRIAPLSSVWSIFKRAMTIKHSKTMKTIAWVRTQGVKKMSKRRLQPSLLNPIKKLTWVSLNSKLWWVYNSNNRTIICN